MAGLTQKQEMFCIAYIETGNASEAYRRAYNCTKMTNKSINEVASKQLSKIKIATRVQELRAPAIENAGLTLERLLLEIKRIATFDIRKMYDENGDPIPIHLLDDDTAAAVSGLDIVEEWDKDEAGNKVLIGYTKKYKTNAKNDAINMGMRHHGAFNDKLNVNVVDDMPARMAAIKANRGK